MVFAVYRSPFAVRPKSSPWALLPLSRANSLDKARQHLLNVRRRTFQHLCLLWSKKSQLPRQQNKTNHFIGRARGYVQELPEFGICRSSTSLSDIGWNGSRSSSHLAGQAKSFGTGISSRRAINTQGQSLAPLPHFDFPEVLQVISQLSVIPAIAILDREYCYNQVPCLFALTANGERQTANPSGELRC